MSELTKSALEYDTFNHWEEDLHEMRMMKYSGPMYVLFNKTTNCLARLLHQRADLVIQNCTRVDYRDPKLGQWDVEEKSTYEQSTVVKWARGVVRIRGGGLDDAPGRRWHPLPDLLWLAGGIKRRNALITIREFSLIYLIFTLRYLSLN